MSGTLFVVATPIGNLEDISPRALRVLREVALIAAEDTRHTAHLLTRFGVTTRTTSLHDHNEREKSGALVERLKAGESIALVSDAGTPTVSDPGSHLIREAIAAGVKIEPIPGPNAAIAALSVSGLPNHEFTFLGFPPVKSKDRKKWFERMVACGHTAIFYESPHRIRLTLQQLLETAGDIDIVLARELTKLHEETIRGSISSVLELLNEQRGEFTVVVDVGRMTKSTVSAESLSSDIAIQFGYMTKNEGMTKRQAMSAIARKHGIPTNEIYAALEKAKK